MTFKKPDSSFWNAKLAVYLHDPFDKALQIKGHETRAQKLREAFGVDADEPPNWKKADGLAAGFERGTLPGYDSDENSSGFVDFTRFPVLTHPVSEKGRLEVDLSGVPSAEAITDAVCAEVRSLLGDKAGKGIGAAFFGDHEGLSRARFLYAHLLLRFKLAEDNVGGLGALWHRMPADTRFPDHSIWQHNALASAFYSTMEMEGSEKGIGMMACSITPVQSFIARARKLRDNGRGRSSFPASRLKAFAGSSRTWARTTCCIRL
jgi:CRISPR-associated protein Cmr2